LIEKVQSNPVIQVPKQIFPKIEESETYEENPLDMSMKV